MNSPTFGHSFSPVTFTILHSRGFEYWEAFRVKVLKYSPPSISLLFLLSLRLPSPKVCHLPFINQIDLFHRPSALNRQKLRDHVVAGGVILSTYIVSILSALLQATFTHPFHHHLLVSHHYPHMMVYILTTTAGEGLIIGRPIIFTWEGCLLLSTGMILKNRIILKTLEGRSLHIASSIYNPRFLSSLHYYIYTFTYIV